MSLIKNSDEIRLFLQTYCVDSQVGDSSCTSTAYHSGIKTNSGIIGLSAEAKQLDCNAQNDENLWTENFASWAGKSCKSTGFVTTSRVTYASVAGSYAHAASKKWENDHEVELSGCDSSAVDDIAEQLVYGDVGNKFEVILGGGRSNFLDKSHSDEEGYNGTRTDGRNLIEEWKRQKESQGKFSYVWNKEELLNVNTSDTKFLLGLFDSDEMSFNLETDKLKKPSLSEMTQTAIKMLEKNENGYFLFVSHGLIDKAHHKNFAQIALDETREFGNAIEMAKNLASEDTLIVVTANHAQTLVYNGYPVRI